VENSRHERWLVLALTLLAFGLRCWGIDYGFPEPWAKPDERRWVGIALGILEDPNPRWFQWPTLHAYLLAAVYWVWGLFRVGRGDFPTYHAYMNEDMFVYPADLVLLGRVVSAATGALCVPLTWKLGERIGPRGSGLVGAALMALSFGPARDAHFALIEPLLLLGIVATLLLVVWALEKPTLARFVLAGIAAGLTTSAKYSGVSLVAPIALAVAFARRSEGRSLLGTAFDARGWAAAAATVAAFFAGSPYMLVSRREFWDSMAMREMSYKDTTFDPDIGFVHHVLFSLRWSHGLAMEVVGLAGLLLLGWRSPARAIVAVYGLATYLGLGPARIIPMRYASSLAPCIVLGVAWALFELSRNWRRRALVVTLAAAALCVDPAYRLVRLGMLLSREDTRHAARLWLNAHYPEGVEILVPDSKLLRWGRPFLEDRYRVIAYEPGLASRKAAPVAMLSESDTGYNPWSPQTQAELRASGTLAALFDPFDRGAKPVYDPHDAFFVPVAGFEGVRQPGPRITIYELRPLTLADAKAMNHPKP
jgi:hypothetical protein